MVEIIDQWRVVVKDKDEELSRLQQQTNHLQTQVHFLRLHQGSLRAAPDGSIPYLEDICV